MANTFNSNLTNESCELHFLSFISQIKIALNIKEVKNDIVQELNIHCQNWNIFIHLIEREYEKPVNVE